MDSIRLAKKNRTSQSHNKTFKNDSQDMLL